MNPRLVLNLTMNSRQSFVTISSQGSVTIDMFPLTQGKKESPLRFCSGDKNNNYLLKGSKLRFPRLVYRPSNHLSRRL